MTVMSPQVEERLRQAFKVWNRVMVFIFRLGLGGIGNQPQTSQVMVLVHTGRKSGRRHFTPLNYALVEGKIYCIAAFGPGSDWYRNVIAHPQVEVWLKDGWWAGEVAEVQAGTISHQELIRQVLLASGFAAPLFTGLNPKTASTSQLADVTANYHLLHIRCTSARTGPGGPGDLAWVWPLTTAVLACVLIRQITHSGRKHHPAGESHPFTSSQPVRRKPPCPQRLR